MLKYVRENLGEVFELESRGDRTFGGQRAAPAADTRPWFGYGVIS